MLTRLAGFAVCALWVSVAVRAEDWNGWRGPRRDGIARNSPRLVDQLPPNGLQPLWVTRELPAASWGSPAVADGRVYLLTHTRKQKPDSDFPPRQFPDLTKEQREEMSKEDAEAYDRKRNEEEFQRRRQDELTETVWCLDARQGTILWKQPIRSVHTSTPHSNTLAIANGKLYLMGAGLDARCLSAETGDVLWTKTLPGEFRDEPVHSSFAVADGVAVILAGRLIALQADTGEVLWTAEKTSGRDSSPVIWKGEGQQQSELDEKKKGTEENQAVSADHPAVIANVGGGETAGFDLKTGEERWRVKSQANVSTPVVAGDRLITQGDSPEAGLRCFRISATQAEPLWVAQRIADRGSSPVVVGDQVFAQSGKTLVCVDLQSGKRQWQARLDLANPQYTSLAAADGKLFYVHDGVLCLAAGPKHRELFAAKINKSGLLADVETHRRLLKLEELESQDGGSDKAHQTFEREVVSQGPMECVSPAIADGRLYVRLKDGLACYDLRRIETAAKPTTKNAGVRRPRNASRRQSPPETAASRRARTMHPQ